MVHLHVYMRNRHDAEASYQCFQDFGSRIKSDDDPGCCGEVWHAGAIRPSDRDDHLLDAQLSHRWDLTAAKACFRCHGCTFLLRR